MGVFPRLTLVLGGARAGKSAHAERIAAGAGWPVCYIATAEAADDEMAARIARHRTARDPAWLTIEAPLDLAAAIAQAPERLILVDCLTLWLSNLMHAASDVDAATDAVLAATKARTAPTIMVANEVGLGIVPENALARAYRDAHGRLNQRVAAAADRALFIAAGLPLVLK
jgi:adenosyl cobinamide kinase/adenosyl cobinamide phosphate guanylyltransferase